MQAEPTGDLWEGQEEKAGPFHMFLSSITGGHSVLSVLGAPILWMQQGFTRNHRCLLGPDTTMILDFPDSRIRRVDFHTLFNYEF